MCIIFYVQIIYTHGSGVGFNPLRQAASQPTTPADSPPPCSSQSIASSLNSHRVHVPPAATELKSLAFFIGSSHRSQTKHKKIMHLSGGVFNIELSRKISFPITAKFPFPLRREMQKVMNASRPPGCFPTLLAHTE